VLDVGVGFGRWGFICRELLDAFRGRVTKSEWKTKIVGLEIFPRYIERHQDYLYDKIIIDCALRYLEMSKYKEDRYDLIIAGDVLEHFKKSDGWKLINQLYARANKAVIFCVPIGTGYPQGTACGNDHEEHKSAWEVKDFELDPRFHKPVFTCKERIKQRPYAVAVMEAK